MQTSELSPLKGRTKKVRRKKGQALVGSIAGKVVDQKGYVTVIDLMLGLKWLREDKLMDWRQGRVPYLERVITANLRKISRTMKAFKAWAIHSNLKPSQTVYKHKNYTLRFSKTGHPTIETAYRTHYVLPMSLRKKRDESARNSGV